MSEHRKKNSKDYHRNDKKYNKELVTRINNNSDVTHIYYDVLVNNNKPNNPVDEGTLRCSFNENRANPYLDTPEDYNVTIPNLKLDINSMPLSVLQPIINSPISFENLFPQALGIGAATEYVIIINSNRFTASLPPFLQLGWVRLFLRWTPPDKTSTIPVGTILTSDNYNNPFFFNYSYNYFINLLNSLISLAFLSGGVAESQPIPYMSYNPVNKRFSLNTPILTSTARSVIETIYFNEALYSLFQ
jgi:hypothetical protein